MDTKHLFIGLILASSSLLLTTSCTKENNGSISAIDLSLAQDETYADALYEEVDNLVSDELASLDKNGYTTDAKKSFSDVCYTVTVDHPDSTKFPKVITMDFGDGCQIIFNGDTIVREGQITITVTGRWFEEGSQHIVSFNDFYINGIKIEGSRTRTNLGLNPENHLELGFELENGKITFNDTLFMTREASHVREIIRRFNPQNDTILITGSANGINTRGQEYNREIIEPFVMVHCSQYNWRWVIADGMVELTNSETGITTIDYNGSGCDGEIIVNKNGYRHNYDFKYNKRFNKTRN
jgi:hypothetical protein